MTSTLTPQRLPWLWLTLLSALWLLAGFMAYGSTGHDDSHINFWNVHTLLTRGELVNYNGERVEQTTSLLQDLLTALLSLILPLHPVTIGYSIDIVAAFATCLLGTHIAARQHGLRQATWLPALALSSSSFLLWSFGGMGAPLTACCLLLVMCYWPRWLLLDAPGTTDKMRLMALAVALVLVRPEMPLVATAIAAAITVASWRNLAWRRRAIALLALTAIAAGVLFAWQQWYFGSWLPIPAVAKQGGDLAPQLWRGARYWLIGSVSNPLLPLALLLSLPMLWRCGRQWFAGTLTAESLQHLTLLAVLWGYGAFIWAAGGDWMQAGRFLVPIVAPAALLILLALENLRWRWLAHSALAVLAGLQLGLQYPQLAMVSHGIPVWVQTRITADHAERYSVFEQLNQEHVRDMAVIDHLHDIIPALHEKLQRPVQLISGQAGMVFYYTAMDFAGKVHFRDLRGLVESSLTLCPLLTEVPRSPQGLFWGYREFFEALPTLQQQCGIAPPDIIYDLNDMNQKMGKTLEPLGYTLVHRENGFVVDNPTSLPYNRLLSPNMIFVRTDLLPLLGNPPLHITDYSQLPLQSRWPLAGN